MIATIFSVCRPQSIKVPRPGRMKKPSLISREGLWKGQRLPRRHSPKPLMTALTSYVTLSLSSYDKSRIDLFASFTASGVPSTFQYCWMSGTKRKASLAATMSAKSFVRWKT